MIKIAYAKLGFWKGVQIGFLLSVACVAVLGLISLLANISETGFSLSRLTDLAHDSSYIFMLIWSLLFVGLPAVLLLWHRRIMCLLGMLLPVVPVGTYMWLFLYGTALAGVKCLGSCG